MKKSMPYLKRRLKQRSGTGVGNDVMHGGKRIGTRVYTYSSSLAGEEGVNMPASFVRINKREAASRHETPGAGRGEK